MAKLKTRTNQPVVDEEGLLEHIAQEGETTVIGGNLYVDGVILGLRPVDIFSLLNLTSIDNTTVYSSPYNAKQIHELLWKYRFSGFMAGESGLILNLKSVTFDEEPDGTVNLFEAVVEGVIHDLEGSTITSATSFHFFYNGSYQSEVEITLYEL